MRNVAHDYAGLRRRVGESFQRLKTVAKAVSVAALYGALWGATSLGVALWAARD